jgi:nitrate reductase NapE component
MMADDLSTQSRKTETPDGAKAVPPKKKGGNRTLVIILIVVFVLLVLPAILLFGFFAWVSQGDNAENIIESAIESSTGGDVDFDSSDGSFSVETKDGEKVEFQSGEGATIAEDFPAEVPLYGNQSLQAASRFGDENNTVWSVQATTSDSRADVIEFFDKELADWEKTFTSSTNDIEARYYKKGELQLQISITSDDDDTGINYNVSKETKE